MCCSVYVCRILTQWSQTIANLKDMMVQRLEAYKRENPKLPARVLVYRDGVSEASGSSVV